MGSEWPTGFIDVIYIYEPPLGLHEGKEAFAERTIICDKFQRNDKI